MGNPTAGVVYVITPLRRKRRKGHGQLQLDTEPIVFSPQRRKGPCNGRTRRTVYVIISQRRKGYGPIAGAVPCAGPKEMFDRLFSHPKLGECQLCIKKEVGAFLWVPGTRHEPMQSDTVPPSYGC